MIMKLSSSSSLLTLTLFVSILSTCHSHFFNNISSIPRSLMPKVIEWNGFNKLAGHHAGERKVPGLSKLKQYFQQFGYCKYANYTDDFDDALESAIRTYQLNFNLNVTGELDAPTLSHIVKPRCGNPDVINGTSTMNSGKAKGNSSSSSGGGGGGSGVVHSVAHYSFFPGQPRWPTSRSDLTYAFFPENQLPSEVKAVFARAFDRWSEATTLTFTETTTSFDSADIKIGFFSGDHGDAEPFDGVLGTLAHAFSPPSGKFHLDGDENWVLDGDFVNAAPSSIISAVDLESVAVHEIGHLLGLGHSSVEESIMYPTITSNTRKVELAQDDIQGIQALYGSNTGSEGPSTPTLIPTPFGADDTSGTHAVSFHGFLLVVGMFMGCLL